MASIQVGGRSIDIGRPDKLLFSDAGLTKRDLCDYYHEMAELILRHGGDHPISMQRCPDGIGKQCFYQKKTSEHFPDWIGRTTVQLGQDSAQEQVVLSDAATLVYLAEQACITPHPWLSRAGDLDKPDRLVFDLDPPDSGDFDQVSRGAKAIRDALDELGLPAYLMTTGSRGLHVVVPLDRKQGFDNVRSFARDLATLVARRNEDTLTVEQRKNKRRGRLFLDFMRNAYGQTVVAPYAVRAKPGAPVATPLDWDELGDTDLDSQSYTVANIRRRMGQKDDPWARMHRHARSLSAPREKLDNLIDESK